MSNVERLRAKLVFRLLQPIRSLQAKGAKTKMFRPQFFNMTPTGFRDVPFVRPVNYGQDVTQTLNGPEYLNNYIVQMDKDAAQIIRSLFWQGAQQGEAAVPNAGSVQVQMRNAFGNFLTDGYVPIWLLCWGAGSTPVDGGSGRAKVFEPELFCPAGSVLIFDFYCPDGVWVAPGLFELRGVKRFPVGVCAL